MFRLHETTRRRVCRTAFALLCVAPTVATFAWILYEYRPWRVADEQTRLGAPWRVNVRLADWSEPRPNAARTTGLTLVEPVSGRVLAELAELELHRGDGGESIAVQSITLDVARWQVLANRAHAWLLGCDESEMQLNAESLFLSGANAAERFEFRNVQLRLERTLGAGVRAQLIARPVGSADNVMIRLTLEKPPGDPSAPLHANLDATTAELPTWLVAAFVPVLSDFGADATFSGSIQWHFAAGQGSGTCQGRLRNVPIASLLLENAPYAAEGRAQVQIAELDWRRQEIERLVGSVDAQNVKMSASLVAAAVKHLFCVPTSAGQLSTTTGNVAAGDSNSQVAIDRLAAHFELTRSGLTVIGGLAEQPGLPAGCLATSGGQAFLVQSPYFPLSAGAWVQFVAGPSTGWVPATQEAIDVAARLPLPISGETIPK